MKWSKDAPTTPGWYWNKTWRYRPRLGKAVRQVRVVEVRLFEDGRLQTVHPLMGDTITTGPVNDPQDEWAGPLAEPATEGAR